MASEMPIEFWWIDSFRINPRGDFYRFTVMGENECARNDRDRQFNWRVPNLRGGGGRYAFRLRVVTQ